jgi:hypothetical protein
MLVSDSIMAKIRLALQARDMDQLGHHQCRRQPGVLVAGNLKAAPGPGSGESGPTMPATRNAGQCRIGWPRLG